jgi:hypothetical protein
VTSPSLFPAILLIAKDRISILNVMLFKINQESTVAIVISAEVNSSTELVFCRLFNEQFRLLSFSGSLAVN